MRPIPAISIIIPVHDPGRTFQRCLEGIRESASRPHEVIIVLDGEPCEPVEVELACSVMVLTTPTARGPAHARNKGAKDASGDILLFLDADVVPSRDVVASVGSYFQENRNVAALVGSYDDDPAVPNFLSQYRNLLHHYVHQTTEGIIPTFWGGCGAIRRNVFHEMGGFDEQYERPCIEDVELGFRLHRAGYRIHMCPSIQVKHLKAWTARSMVTTDIFDRALPWSLLLLERRDIPNTLNLRIKERWSVLATALLLASVLCSFLWLSFGFVALLSAVALLGLNASLYTFFRRKRGTAFTLQAIPWHVAYYLCCGIGAALGITVHGLSSLGIRPTFLHRLLPRPV